MSNYQYHRIGPLTPWAEAMLSREEISLLRKSRIVSVSGRSARGPWIATGPGGRHEGTPIRAIINAAAGETIV